MHINVHLAEQSYGVLQMSDNPIPLSQWQKQGNTYPSQNGWYNMLRPGDLRDELFNTGVVTRVNGRYLINPANWRAFCANRLRNF